MVTMPLTDFMGSDGPSDMDGTAAGLVSMGGTRGIDVEDQGLSFGLPLKAPLPVVVPAGPPSGDDGPQKSEDMVLEDGLRNEDDIGSGEVSDSEGVERVGSKLDPSEEKEAMLGFRYILNICFVGSVEVLKLVRKCETCRVFLL